MSSAPSVLSKKVTPAKAAVSVGAFGVLSTLAGIFDVPAASHTVQSVATGGGLTVVAVTVVGFLLHHLGVSKAEITTGETFIEEHLSSLEKAAQVAEQLPGVSAALTDAGTQLADVKRRLAGVEAAAAKVAPAPVLDVAKLAEDVRALIVGDVVKAAPKPAVKAAAKKAAADPAPAPAPAAAPAAAAPAA